jgi:class I fructose-bisphosphate aldolase
MATELKRSETTLANIEELLGSDAKALLEHKSQGIPSDQIQLPGPDFIDRVWTQSDRSPGLALAAIASMIMVAWRTGYLSILPVDQGTNIPPAPLSPRTRSTLIRQIS